MNDVAIYVHAGEVQRLTQATNLALMALSDGYRALLGLFWDGLAGWVGQHDPALVEPPGFTRGPWAPRMAQGFSRVGIPTLVEQLATCREVGAERLSVLACSASVEVLGLEAETLTARGIIDDVVGLPTIWRRSRGMRVLTI